jgi:tryptophanyl-tRNA synthetase
MNEGFEVTPYKVTGDIDYDELVERFGTKMIDEALMKRLARHGPLHPMIRRGIFYSHRDFDWILDQHEKGAGFTLYPHRPHHALDVHEVPPGHVQGEAVVPADG